MKVLIIGSWIAAAAVLATAVPATAQNTSGAGTKVAYVNTVEILRKTPEYAKAESLYAKEYEGAQKEGEKIRGTLDSLAADFERQSAMLTATQKAAKRKTLEEEAKKTDERLGELRKRIQLREQELLAPIQKRINSVIEGIRAGGGYAFIFDVSAPNSGIVTADTSLDLTQKVLDQLK